MTRKYTLFVTIFLLALIFPIIAVAQPQVIAHRGYWKTNGSAQNSIAALLKADSLKLFGSEMDVWLSSDDVPVVNHDAHVVLDGKEIVIQEHPIAILRKVKLANGETLPTFEEYLDEFIQCTHTKLIIELKPHREKYQEDALAEKVMRMVRDRQLHHRVEYISFSLNLIVKLIQLDPLANVYYLNGDLSPNTMRQIGASGIDYHYQVILNHPEWIELAHKLGQKVNVWTVNKVEDIQKMIDLNVDFITTDEPLRVLEMIQNFSKK